MEFLVHHKGSTHLITRKVNKAIRLAKKLASGTPDERFKFLINAEIRIDGEPNCNKISRLFYFCFEGIERYNQANWGLITPHMLYTLHTLPVPEMNYELE